MTELKKSLWGIVGDLHGQIPEELPSFVSPVQTFITKTYNATYTGLNSPNSFCILLLRRKFHFHLDSFYARTYRTDSWQNVYFSQITTIWSYSSLGWTIIYFQQPLFQQSSALSGFWAWHCLNDNKKKQRLLVWHKLKLSDWTRFDNIVFESI